MNRTMVVAIGIVAVLLLAGCPNPMDPMSGAGDEVDRVDALGRGSRTPPPSETGFFPDRNAERFALRSYLGWTFEAVAKSEDGRIVVGNAVNENGYDRGRYEVAAGTTAGVYWVTGTTRGRDWALGPFVIGIVKDDITESRRHRALYRQILTRFGLFSLDSFESRLASVDTIGNGESEKTYIVTGSGSDGTALAATIEGTKVVLIEEIADDPGDQPVVTNSPPTAIFPAGDLLVEGAGPYLANGVYTITPEYGNSKIYSNGSYYVFLAALDADGDGVPPFVGAGWVIDTAPALAVDPSAVPYVRVIADGEVYVEFPPPTGWESPANPTGSSPGVYTLPFWSDSDYPNGGSYSDGTVVSVKYEFQDPDGDGEGATIINWFRYQPVTGATEQIANPDLSPYNAPTYTVSSSIDAGYRFFVVITPVDEIGAAGSAVTSGYSLIVR